jgi:hypothetical protein
MSKKQERPLSANQEKALELITTACDIMNWSLAIPQDLEDQPIYYLIIGTDEGIDIALKRMNGEVQ